MNNLALRDKSDQGVGLSLSDAAMNQITLMTTYVNIDTRDCVGELSLKDSEVAFELSGGRGLIYGNITNVSSLGLPAVITMSPLSMVEKLRNNDEIIIKEVTVSGPEGYGYLSNVNGKQIINGINYTLGTANVFGVISNGNYKSGGIFSRKPDTNFPMKKSTQSFIKDNKIIVNLKDSLKEIREIVVDYVTIPRDLIPIQVYMLDLIDASTSLTDTTYTSTSSEWSTYIPQEPNFLEERLLGFYSTPIDVFRTYINGAFSLQDAQTPGPFQLWNPPVGPWPKQPVPYPFQTVPTYQSNEFLVNGLMCHLVLGGYGVYDLNDWTSNTGDPINDAAITSIVRKLLLILICPIQSYNEIDYVTLILNSNTVSNNVAPFGYGDFQRFVPGPGIGLNYQPASTGGDPTIVSVDSPVPFPNFRGNVWGPYNRPGDRFQKLGLRTVLQDLFLNGDLQNISGSSIIKQTVPTEDFMSDPTFGLDFSVLAPVDLNNVNSCTNLNILNAMRITPNGYGTTVLRANGDGIPYYSQTYKQGGGIGPDSLGPPSTGAAWVNNGVNGGTGDLSDPIATGPSSSNITADSSDPSISASNITYNTSWSDSGEGNGKFISQMINYVGYTINDVPDTDLVMFINDYERNEKSLSTNQKNYNANLLVPMRLNVGNTNGTLQYIDSIFNLLNGSPYWTERFLTPKSLIRNLELSFFTYEGTPINIEKMLQQRKSLQFLQLFTGIINDNLDVLPQLTNLNFYFLFDPFNPILQGRMKRYIQLILKVDTYNYVLPGKLPDAIGEKREEINQKIINQGPNTNNTHFANYQKYNNYP